MNAPLAVVFDLDDTLYPERVYVRSGFTAVAGAMADVLGDPADVLAEMTSLFESDRRGEVFQTVLKRRGLGACDDLLARMIEVYRAHRPAITLYADADAALTRLRPACRLGLITDGRPLAQWNKIDALGLRDRLDEIIVTDELGPHARKPDPSAFREMSDRLGLSPDRCIYVADNAAKDFLAPNALGWTTVHLRRPDGFYTHLPPPPGGQPHHTVHTLDEFDLQRIGGGGPPSL